MRVGGTKLLGADSGKRRREEGRRKERRERIPLPLASYWLVVLGIDQREKNVNTVFSS